MTLIESKIDGSGTYSPSDEELVERALAGDRDALGELLERHVDHARRIARIRMSRDLRAFMESADLAQEALLLVARHLGTFQSHGSGSFVAWLSRIVQNQVRDAAKYVRAQCRDPRRAISLELLAGSDDPARMEPTAPGRRPWEVAIDNELREICDSAVAALPCDMREVVLLRDYAGASWSTLEAALGRDSGPSVRTLYRRATIRMARSLARRTRARGEAS